MKRPLISVVVLTYKRFDTIKKTIESIYEQDYNSIELVISDDGSQNFDREFIEQLISDKKDRFVNCIIRTGEKNCGTVINFNEAIKSCNGEVIMPLSPDDVFYDNTVVSKVEELFRNENVLVCTGKRMLVDDDGKEIEVLPTAEQIQSIKDDLKGLFNVMCEGNLISGACTYYRRSVFEKFGFFNTDYKLMEDYPFYLKLLLENERIYFLDYVTIKYGVGGVSSPENLNPIYVEDWKKLYNDVIFKSKNILTNKSYRTSRLDYYRHFYKKDKMKYLTGHIKYMDVTIAKALKKIK